MLSHKHKLYLFKISMILILINIFYYIYLNLTHKQLISVLTMIESSIIIILIITCRFIYSALSSFFNGLYLEMDKMIKGETINKVDIYDDTYISQTYHQLYKLYDILSAHQDCLKSEKNKLESFISDISHQIKTPIANVKLLQSTLDHLDLNSIDYQKYLTLQKTQINKLDFLTQALIKTSRLENGFITFNPKCSIINHTIIAALEGILVSAEKKEIKVSFDNSTEYLILHDIKWTTEAIFNILENAVKYTPKGGRIDITLQKTEKYLKISITDNGIGITEENIPNIFKRFWRGTLNVAEGNGIGLYLCKEIISLQGGYILVSSQIDKGTSFQVFLAL